MKIIKHTYILLILFVICALVNATYVSANQKFTSDDNSATWQVNEKNTQTIGSLTHSLMYGTSTDTTQQSVGNQKVNIFEMKTDGINSKLVTWAMQTGKGSYTRNGLSIIAEDYEEKHPGWIVVAGINGDQYYTKYGSGLGVDGSFYYPNQPYYPMIIDGERRFPITPTGNSTSHYVGSDGKVSACSAGDLGLIPGSGRSPEEGYGNPLQHFCLENPMDRGAWWATVHEIAKSQTRLSD